MSKKNITIISSLIAFIVIVAGGYFFYKNSGQNNTKADHNKYLALINDHHNFDEGVKGLESLDNDKGQKIFKNIKIEIKIAKELKNTNTSLDNKDIDSAKKSLEKVETLNIDNSFDKAIDWLKEDITNYEKAKKEIEEAKFDDINTIIDKYKFNHSSLKEKLSNIKTKEEKNKTQNNNNQSSQETKNEYKVDNYDIALAQNFKYYQDTIFSYIKTETNKYSQASGVKADRVEYGGIDSRGIIVKIFDNEKGEVGHYIFKYNVNANVCTLDSIQAGPVAYYKAIYHI